MAKGPYAEAYGPPKTKKGLKCRFDGDPIVFHCATANAGWVKTPEGEPRVEQAFRFAIDACKGERG